MSPAGVLFATFAVLMLLGSPITVALGVAAMAALYTVDQNLVTRVQIAFTSVNSFPIMALPAFMLVGALMECAGISRRLVAIAENIVGPIPGGLAVSTALACVFFGAISGSGPATTAAVGMLMIPAMIRRGFSKGYAAAAAATAGGVGIIIPPSIPMVVYAVSGQQSITKMFLAGVMPGIMIAVGLAAMHLFLCRNMPVAEDLQSGSGDSLLKALKDGLWSLMAPVVILGGIYGGFFTPTEAAVVAIFYSIFVGLFIHRELTFGGIRHSLQITSWMTGRVLIIMFTAYAFERLLVQYRIPDMIVDPRLHLGRRRHLDVRHRPAALSGDVHGDAGDHPAGDSRTPAGHDRLRRGPHPLRRGAGLLLRGRVLHAAPRRKHLHRLGHRRHHA